MKTLRVELKGAPSATLSAVLDGQKMAVVANAAKRQVRAGKHELHWFITAPPATTYSIKLTSPPEATSFKLDNQTMTSRGWNAGVWKPTVT